jgi:hypothetical protein
LKQVCAPHILQFFASLCQKTTSNLPCSSTETSSGISPCLNWSKNLRQGCPPQSGSHHFVSVTNVYNSYKSLLLVIVAEELLASVIGTYHQDVSLRWYGCHQTEVRAGGWLVIWH